MAKVEMRASTLAMIVGLVLFLAFMAGMWWQVSYGKDIVVRCPIGWICTYNRGTGEIELT